jgi:ABC-type nickel/cobalt efflux system permease component RcnA
MHIKWNALGEVATVSFAVGVAIVVIFAVGILAWSVRSPEGAHHGRGGNTTLATAAGLCFLACAVIVGYGIYLIVPQFH